MSIGAPVWLRSYDLDQELLNVIENIISGAPKGLPRHVYVLASREFAARLRELFAPAGEDIFQEGDCYDEFFITAAAFARRLEQLAERLAAERERQAEPGGKLLHYDYIIIPRLAEFVVDAGSLLALLKTRLTPAGLLITAQLNADYRPILQEAQEGWHRFFDRHLYGRREISDLMYASFYKDVALLPLGQDTGRPVDGKNNRFWLALCRPHTPIVRELKLEEKYPGENGVIAARLRRIEYEVEKDGDRDSIAEILIRRLAVFISSIIFSSHRENFLRRISSALTEAAAGELKEILAELELTREERELEDFADLSEPEEKVEIPAPVIDGQPHTIAFVTCVNDEAAYAECRHYLKSLSLPAGWSAQLIPVRGAASMAAGYEQGRRLARQAAIIVYLHQDVLVVNKKLVENLLSLFACSDRIGLVGVIGCRRLPETGIWWDGRRLTGQVLHACEPESISLASHHEPSGGKLCQGVEAVDGLFLAARGPAFGKASAPPSLPFRGGGRQAGGVNRQDESLTLYPSDGSAASSSIEEPVSLGGYQSASPAAPLNGSLGAAAAADSIYDISWRCDLFDGWHFYDSSLCREYRRRGLAVVVPRQSPDFWCIHCPAEKPLDPAYHRYRQRFLQEYGAELKPEV